MRIAVSSVICLVAGVFIAGEGWYPHNLRASQDPPAPSSVLDRFLADTDSSLVRCYARVSGVRVPIAMSSTADVLLAGTSTFSMEYEYESINGTPVPAKR